MEPADRRSRLREHTSAVLEVVDTPVYIFFEDDLRSDYRHVRSALDEHYPDSTIHYAVKANYLPGICAVLRDEGCSAEVYASGEVTAALRAGFDPSSLLVTGMNRKPADLVRALETGVERFLVDNETELDRLVDAAKETGARPEVLIRGNPAMDVPTNPEVATATRETKFGLDIASGRAMAVAEQAVAASGIDLVGVQLHLGSQIQEIEPYDIAAREMLAFAAEIRDSCGVEIELLDLGGGFPIPYEGVVPELPAIVERLADAVRTGADAHDLSRPHLILEPGRRLVGNAGTLLGTVGVVKETPYKTFAVLDVGTNAVSSYWPYPIHALSTAEPTERYHVAGPLCYTGDVISEDVRLPPLERGDRLAIDRVGAYSLGSASHVNAQPKPPVVLVRSNGDVAVIRAGETIDDVLRGSVVPGDLR